MQVEQIDREAAASLTGGQYWNEVKRGHRDADQLVQAFARHRHQAERETVQKIVAWLMREEEDYPSSEYSGFAAMIREEIEAGEWK